MLTPAWPSVSDPRHLVQIGWARVRLGESLQGADQPSARAWHQRVEDALRCASLGDAQRLVLIRKLQVRTGSALAPGWSEVVQAAAQDAMSRACHGRSAGAARSDAVWFESWDDAVAAWLDAALGLGGPELTQHAWYWSRIARMAGLPAELARPASGGASSGLGAPSTRDEQARAMWARWQADPISHRACKAWSVQRSGRINRLTGTPVTPEVHAPEVAAQPVLAGGAAHSPQALPGSTEQALTGNHAHPPVAEHLRWGHHDQAMAQVTVPKTPLWNEASAHPGWAQAQQGGPDAASTLSTPSEPDGAHGLAPLDLPATTRTGASSATGRPEAKAPHQDQSQQQGLGDRPQACSVESGLKPDRLDAAEPHGRAAQRIPASMDEAEVLVPTFRALAWTHLRFTQLGGLPFTIQALQGLGFAHALKAQRPTQDGFDERIAASAPWLHLWARLGPLARQQWMRDPMFAALPAFETVEDLPLQAQAPALWACWQAQPESVRSLGQAAWGKLHRAMRQKGWRSAMALLQRPAWMQLSSTHLDVVFTLDQADLKVRRQGLDADPGWVPWLGRIVSLHFEPASDLPTLPAALPPRNTP